MNKEPDEKVDVAGTEDKRKKWTWPSEKYIAIIAILTIVLLAVLVVCFWDNIKHLQNYGYAGAFIVSLLGSATVIIPVPALAAVFALGGVLHYPFLVGIAVGLAEPIGELTGYMAGRAGHTTFKNRHAAMFVRTQDWMTRRGSLFLFLMSAVPNPFFDLAGVAAGAIRYPPLRV